MSYVRHSIKNNETDKIELSGDLNAINTTEINLHAPVKKIIT